MDATLELDDSQLATLRDAFNQPMTLGHLAAPDNSAFQLVIERLIDQSENVGYLEAQLDQTNDDNADLLEHIEDLEEELAQVDDFLADTVDSSDDVLSDRNASLDKAFNEASGRVSDLQVANAKLSAYIKVLEDRLYGEPKDTEEIPMKSIDELLAEMDLNFFVIV
jgi:septal ring factor EnvC (AmiA/AmiB activator)